MYIDVVPNRSSPPAVLLRESRREGNRIRKRTLANLSGWPEERVQTLRLLLRGQRLVPADELLVIEKTLPHGHVQAVLHSIGALELDRLIASRGCRQRDLVVAMIAAQLLCRGSKPADMRLWNTTTLAQQLGVEDADESELCQTLGWLVSRQSRIENKLAERHLEQGSRVFYNVTGGSHEGESRPPDRRGCNRDGEKGVAPIVYGTPVDGEGRPIGVEVHPGDTADPSMFFTRVATLHGRFGAKRVVVVGDQDLVRQAQIELLEQHPGVGWITTARAPMIRQLVEQGTLHPSLFGERHLAEINCPEYPGERMIAYHDPLAADGICLVRTSETRESLPAAEVVRAYRNLSRMKWMCRALDGLETLVHPIRRRVEDRLRGHVFLCMLAYYVEWHMRQVLKPLLFEEEQIEPSRGSRHPVSRATSSKSGQSKKTTLSAPEGFPPHSFAALMEALAARCQCRCRLNSGGLEASFIQVAEPDALQRRAYELLNRIYRPSALS